MKELARIMRFDLLTAAGTPGSMQLALFFSAVSILLGLFFFPLGCVYMVFSIPGMFILPLGSAAEKNGFKTITKKKLYYSDGEDAIYMVRCIL